MHKGMPPLVLMDVLDSIVKWELPCPQPAEFCFAWTKEATMHNLNVLETYNMDLE